MTKKRILNIVFAIILFCSIPLPMILGVIGILDPGGESWRLVIALGIYLVAPVSAIRLALK